jgi:hypothetical protein
MWKPVVTYEDSYEVSSDGWVRTLDRICDKRRGIVKSKVLNQFDNHGYRFVILSRGGKRRNFYVHRLVAESFLPNPENKPQINHINGNKSDNRLSNLEWSTIKDNHLHSYRYLNRKSSNNQGHKNPNARLSLDQVKDIISRYMSGVSTAKVLAMEFGINKNYVYQMAKGKTWKTELETSNKA